MAVKIRLKRMGAIRNPIYRIVVMDSRTKRDGRAIEEIGKYDPNQEPSLIEIDMERADYWISQGAQPTEAVARQLEIVRGGKLKVAEPKQSKRDLYEAAIAAVDAGGDVPGATTPKKKAEKKADEAPAADETPADTASADTASAETAPATDTDGGQAAAESTDADADATTPAEAAADTPTDES